MIYFIIYVTPKINLTSAFCLQKAHLKLTMLYWGGDQPPQ